MIILLTFTHRDSLSGDGSHLFMGSDPFSQVLPRPWKSSSHSRCWGPPVHLALFPLFLSGVKAGRENEKKSIKAPNRQLAFQGTKVILRAYLPHVSADKGCLCKNLAAPCTLLAPLQISANDNIIITLPKQRQREFQYPLFGCSRGACVSSGLKSRCRG